MVKQSDWQYKRNCELFEGQQLPDGVSRFALSIAYNGSRYCGWQFQDHSPSVQAVIEKAITQVADEPIRTICAGRTDTGVHASGQVVHFDTTASRSTRNWLLGINVNLPKDVSVNWVKEVPGQFHARFSATHRRYRYLISNTASRSGLFGENLTWEKVRLNEELMNSAAQSLVGEHDFSSFRASGCQAKSPIRRVTEISVQRKGNLVWLDVAANAFLHHMVRNIVGVLLRIGREEAEPGWVEQLLLARDRKLAGITAPPNGLYLTAVDYPANFALPSDEVPLLDSIS